MKIKGCSVTAIATLILLAGCQRSTEALPPMPPMPTGQDGSGQPAETAAPAESDIMGANNAAGEILPGSIEDFIAQAGSDRVLFAYNSQDLDDTAKAILRRQAQWLLRYPQIVAVIEGYTDENGTREYNYALGARRAAAIRTFLAAQGVDSGRMTTISFGKDRPAVEGSDDAADAQNRRGITALTNAPTR